MNTGLAPTDWGVPAWLGRRTRVAERSPLGHGRPCRDTRPMQPQGGAAVLSGEEPMRRCRLVSTSPLVVHLLGVVLAFRLLAGPGVAGEVVNPHGGERIGTVQEVYDGALLPDLQVQTFRNTDRLFPTRTVRRGGSG